MGNMYERIVALCDAKGIKPGRVCADTGLSRGMMTDLKMGRTKELSAKNTKIIADYFGVSTDYLLGTETEKAPTPEGRREVPKEELMAAFWGGDKDLSREELDAMWKDVERFAAFVAEQKRRERGKNT